MLCTDDADDITRETAAYVLSTQGLELDEHNFVIDRAAGFRTWVGLGAWVDRLANALRIRDEYLNFRKGNVL